MNAASIQIERKNKEIKKLILGLAEYYNHQITSVALLNAYAEDLEDICLEVLCAAIKLARRESKFFPMPATIREYALGSTRDEGQDIACKIVDAMHKFGWVNPNGARIFIGEIGWKVVERDGGWQNLCSSIQNYDELGTRKAQWRELSIVFLKREAVSRESNIPRIGWNIPNPLIEQALKDMPKDLE